ncbi:alpha-amylase [Bifidobacterium goeldii]|uniref:Alpha-amylase n=1 Tax=Bifidobacterium goeldii TaxID=2306975 RepID=A0A430FEP0_9BIFI|nr:alpha-amylase family glycosyl hydrolase [Bifidobacterium goeldii]RSX51319.1 alpha-amylase [Bifidobacterium goeldii]
MEDTRHTSPSWLSTGVFYEIYPQSFADSNGDGIGDIPGIIEHLDYIKNLGCNALWINPCYDSPFKDAGYDVRDYRRVAPRYGTNDDLIALFAAAHERDMHVLLDLVPGHTSEEHPWFRASCNANPTDRTVPSSSVTSPENDHLYSAPSAEGAVSAADWGSVTTSAATTTSPNAAPENVSERYIWTDSWIAGGDGLPFIAGEAERDGTYILNFFKCQPALNYGFAHPKYAWQKPALGPDALATCDAMIDIIRFWLSRGADGFRVDMADSLVKHDDEGKPATIRTWQYIFSKVHPEFPEAAFVSEWGRPYESLEAGFDMDFYLDWRWDGNPNGYNMLLRNTDTPLTRDGDLSYFNADSPTGIKGFLDQYLPQLRDAERLGGYFSLITCNHDTPRVAQRLTERELKLAYATLFTLPGVPFLYYGDEIGMRYRAIPAKEGSYVRTGSRTPMQWDHTANLGFSTASAENLYLPVDPAADAPTVDDRMNDPDSLWHTIQSLLALRHAAPALHADAGFEPIVASADTKAFVYRRRAQNDAASDVSHNSASDVIIAVNPATTAARIDRSSADNLPSLAGKTTLFVIGDVTIDGDALALGPQSFAILG